VYVGATVDPARRLRQHNAELKGGARLTTRASAAGARWSFLQVLTGFQSKHDALSLEWWIKRTKRTQRGRLRRAPPRERVLAVIAALRLLPRWAAIVDAPIHVAAA